MPCASIVGRWEVRPLSALRGLGRTRALMWQRIQGGLQSCQRGEGYRAPGTYDNDIQDNEPMGSERMEMRKRQMSVQQESVAVVTAPAQQDQGGPPTNQRGSNACCFCWCCCCSCSWNEDREDRSLHGSYDAKTEGNGDCEDSPKPTLEEVRTWGQSFDKLMACPVGRNAFRQFLRTEFSEENMLFWLACEEFSKEGNKSVIEEKARLIYEDYVSILSPKEVSLDSRVREVINKNMLEPTCHTFDDAQLQIYTLMQRDSYPRYMNSQVYKNLLNGLSEQSPES